MGGRRNIRPGIDDVEWNFAGATKLNSVCGGVPEACGISNNLGSITNKTLSLWPREEAPLTFLDFETGVSVRHIGLRSASKLLELAP